MFKEFNLNKIIQLEKEFGIKITEENLGKVDNFSSLLNLTNEIMGKNA